MVLMSMSSSLRPTSGVNFPHIVAWKVHATSSPLTSQDQTIILASFAFSPPSDELERSSSPGHGHFLCLLQESSQSYECQLLIRSASSPRCYQSGCGVSYLGFAMSFFWMVCEDQGCLSVLDCHRLQTLEV